MIAHLFYTLGLLSISACAPSYHGFFFKSVNSPYPMTNDTIKERLEMEATAEKKPVTYEEKKEFGIEHEFTQEMFLTRPYPITLDSKVVKNRKVPKNGEGHRIIDILENHLVLHPCLKEEKPSDRKMDQIVHKMDKVVYKRYTFFCGKPDENNCSSWLDENSMSDLKEFDTLFIMRDDNKGVLVKEVRSIQDCILHRNDDPSYYTRTDRLYQLGLTWETYLALDMDTRENIFKISQEMYRETKKAQRILAMASGKIFV